MTSSGNKPSALPTLPAEPVRLSGNRLRVPVLAALIGDRRVAICLVAIAAAQMLAALLRFRTVRCPLLAATGVPCPGCGLSRGCGAFVTGDWQTWLNYHLFAPAFLAAAAVILLSVFLPTNLRAKLVEQVSRIERATAIVPLTIIGIIVYWLLRLGFASSSYLALMRAE